MLMMGDSQGWFAYSIFFFFLEDSLPMRCYLCGLLKEPKESRQDRKASAEDYRHDFNETVFMISS